MALELTGASKKNDANSHHGERIILRLTYISRYNTDNANIEVCLLYTSPSPRD